MKMLILHLVTVLFVITGYPGAGQEPESDSCTQQYFKLDAEYLGCLKSDPIAGFIRQSFDDFLKGKKCENCSTLWDRAEKFRSILSNKIMLLEVW